MKFKDGKARPPRIRVDGTELVLPDGSRIRLRFLETYRVTGLGEDIPRVRVYCRGCGRHRTADRVGLRVTEPGVVDFQANCHQCRAEMKRAGRRGD